MMNTAAAVFQRVRRLDTARVRPRIGLDDQTPRDAPAPRVGRSAFLVHRGSWLLLVTVAFAVSRAAYAAAGVRFDDSALHPTTATQVQWQLLPLGLLRHDLGRAVWNLHGQPPLYNLFCGLLLHLPTGWEKPFALSLYTALGLALALVTFTLLEAVCAKRVLALTVTLLVIANPAVVLYENWLSWSYPTAVLLAAGMFFVLRWVTTESARWAGAAMACFSSVVLLDATFQWPWLLAIGTVLLLAHPRRLRRCLAALCVPLVLTAGWYVKGAVQFGTSATSSWLGMNLYQTTLEQAPKGDIHRLVREGRLDPLAEVASFKPIDTYVPRFTSPRRTGVPALDVATAEQGVPNFNNTAYLDVSSRYLHDDLSYIRARPARYVSAVTLGAEVWSIPADQYGWVKSDDRTIKAYAHLYDALVMLQPEPGGWHASAAAELQGKRPPPSTVSWTIVALTALDLLVAPVLLVLRRRNRIWLVCGAAMWLTVLYSFAVTSLTEIGENMRFRFELGTLPLVLAVAVVATAANADVNASATRRRSAGAGSSTGP